MIAELCSRSSGRRVEHQKVHARLPRDRSSLQGVHLEIRYEARGRINSLAAAARQDLPARPDLAEPAR